MSLKLSPYFLILLFLSYHASVLGSVIDDNYHDHVHIMKEEYIHTPFQSFHLDDVWAHAVNSKKLLKEVMEQNDVTSLEVDVRYGVLKVSSTSQSFHLRHDTHNNKIPICAHPPLQSSDLSLEDLIDVVNLHNYNAAHSEQRQNAVKVLKLDLKDLNVIEPAMEVLNRKYDPSQTYTVLLNADILSEPGTRYKSPRIEGHDFLGTVQHIINSNGFNQHLKEATYLSVGWSALFATFDRYTMKDVNELYLLLKEYDLHDKPIQIQANARLVMKDPAPFDYLMEELMPQSCLLMWRSKEGEVPLNPYRVKSIMEHFKKRDTLDRVGLDGESSRSLITIAFNEVAVCILNLLNSFFEVVDGNIWMLVLFVAMMLVALIIRKGKILGVKLHVF